MGTATMFCIGWMLCVGTAASLPAQSELQYYHLPGAAFNPKTLGHVALHLSFDKPADDCLPEADSSHFNYFKWPTRRVGSGFVWIALQQQDSQGTHDRLYVDTNRDGSLHDKIPTPHFHQQTSSGRTYDLFGPIELRFPDSEEARRYHLSVASVSGRGKSALILSPAGMFQGTLTAAGGRSTSVVIKDFTVNAFYNDTSEDPGQSDKIVMATHDGRQHDFHPGRYVAIDPATARAPAETDCSKPYYIGHAVAKWRHAPDSFARRPCF